MSYQAKSSQPSTFLSMQLHENIQKALSSCGYLSPTPVQEKAIPVILAGKDVVVSAQTGTGKTAAFILPALQKLSTGKPHKKPRVLILTPTRELATQVTNAAALYGKFLHFRIISLVGGMSYTPQIKDLERGADIIVATPGRLLDHLEQKRVNLSEVGTLILDEADRMLDMGFIDDVEYIAKLTPSARQTLLFSATVDDKLTKVVKHLLKHPERIDLSEKTVSAPLIKQRMIKVSSPHAKLGLLADILEKEAIFKAIIFSATKINADRLATALSEKGFKADALHGDLRQNVRNRTLTRFRQGKIQFLVATDVAARGINVSDITHVINYDIPRFSEDYVHRIGRTGRAGKEGVAISFILPSEMRHLAQIERFIGKKISFDKGHDHPTKSEKIVSTANKPNQAKPKRFEKEGRFKKDKKFEKPKRFEREGKFEKDKKFEKPKRFEKEGKFEKDKKFEKPKRFEKEGKFEKDKKFEKPKRFEKERKFEKDKKFEKPKRFEKEGKFENNIDADKKPFKKRFKKPFDEKPSFSKKKPSDRKGATSKPRSSKR